MSSISETPSPEKKTRWHAPLTSKERIRVYGYRRRNKSIAYCAMKTGYNFGTIRKLYGEYDARAALPKLSPAIIRKLLAEHKAWGPICKILQRSKYALCQYCRRNKIETGMRREPLTPAQKKEIIRLRLRGYSYKKIGVKIGRSWCTVMNYYKRRRNSEVAIRNINSAALGPDRGMAALGSR